MTKRFVPSLLALTCYRSDRPSKMELNGFVSGVSSHGQLKSKDSTAAIVGWKFTSTLLLISLTYKNHTTGFVHTRCALLRDDRASALYSRSSTGFCTFFSKVSRQVKTQRPHNPKITVQHHPLHHADDLSPTRCSYRRIASAKHRSFLSIVLCRHHG